MNLNNNDPLQSYMNELGTIRPLTKDEETDLLQHVWAQDDLAEAAGRRLIEANLSLVVSIAKRQRASHIHMLELIQKGNEALIVALKTFTRSSRENFSAHAAACVESAVFKAVGESQSGRE